MEDGPWNLRAGERAPGYCRRDTAGGEGPSPNVAGGGGTLRHRQRYGHQARFGPGARAARSLRPSWSASTPPGAAAVGGRWPVLPVGHHPAAGGRHRLRLAAARRLPAARRSASVVVGRATRPVPVRDVAAVGVVVAAAVALGVSVVRRTGRREPGERERLEQRIGAGGGDDRHRPRRERTRHRVAPGVPARRSISSPRPIGSVGLVAAGDRRRRHRRGCRSPARWSAPRSSGRSPTRCSSATGTWCSPGWPGARCSSWCAGPRWIWPFEVVGPADADRHGVGAQRHRSTTATAACSAGCGWPAR